SRRNLELALTSRLLCIRIRKIGEEVEGLIIDWAFFAFFENYLDAFEKRGERSPTWVHKPNPNAFRKVVPTHGACVPVRISCGIQPCACYSGHGRYFLFSVQRAVPNFGEQFNGELPLPVFYSLPRVC